MFNLFSNYGEVLDVNAKKNIKMRGQAFVIFKDAETAESAIDTLQNYMFYGKPMKLDFAKQKSVIIQQTLGQVDEEAKVERD